MKKSLLALSALLLVFTAFTPAPDQKYKVENTIANWQSKLSILETAKQIIKNSDAPSKTAIPVMDSLTSFQQEIIAQVQPQMPKDTTNKK